MKEMKKRAIMLIASFMVMVCIGGCGSDGENKNGPENEAIAQFEAAKTVVGTASDQYKTMLAQAPDTATARQNLADWLGQQSGVSSAELASDGITIQIEFDTGLNYALITQSAAGGKKSSIPAYPAYKETPRKKGAAIAIPANPDYMQSVGMMTFLVAPFHWECKKHFLYIETDDIANGYIEPITGQSLANVYKDSEVTPEVMAALLLSPNTPATHLYINTHTADYRWKENGTTYNSIAFFTGQEITRNNYADYSADVQQSSENKPYLLGGLIDYEDKTWLCVTPLFVKKYSGKPHSSCDDWLGRYVTVVGCNSYDEYMRNVFLDNGAVSYAGFDSSVDRDGAARHVKKFYDNLLTGDLIQEAYNNLPVYSDIAFPAARFQIDGGTMTARYFYRPFVAFNGTSMEGLTCQWESMFEDSDGSIYMVNNIVDSVTKAATGLLTIRISSCSAGTYNIQSENVKISFDELSTGTTWIAEKSSFEATGACSGNITISSFDDRVGGVIEGTFSGTLVDSSEVDPPYTTREVSGNFVVLKNNNGWGK
ncbi:MAG: hypothetical protein GY754_01445 [bacterium]|nr:hypothetical protein [bacterium]